MTTQPNPGTWTWPDAWILASISGQRRGMALSELIASADGHNHAIPTRDELASALGSLIAAGLVETIDGGFRTTAEGELIKKKWRGGMFSWSESLLPQLERLAKADQEYPLTEDEVAQAFTDYVRRV